MSCHLIDQAISTGSILREPDDLPYNWPNAGGGRETVADEATEVQNETAEADILVRRAGEITREMLRDGIRLLQGPEREALRLATRDRLTVPAIAVQLGLEPNDVFLHLRNGLLTLRGALISSLAEREVPT
ncbi:MAG TPA: hypothetical protein PK691_12550 [Thermomicrobiales bacterium]|nr:hypothetical protein [Thermomicrobiales bacterium]